MKSGPFLSSVVLADLSSCQSRRSGESLIKDLESSDSVLRSFSLRIQKGMRPGVGEHDYQTD
jgi:hypothetical protein